MTFRSSILAGVTLVRKAIQSPNYLQGSTGWTINQDGSAEFNNITIRGGSTVSGVSLFYNGTPASGNLIGSMAAAAGTDAYGNAYFAGVTQYDLTDGTFANVYNGLVRVGVTANGLSQAGLVGYTTVNTGITLPGTAIISPTDNTYTSHGAVVTTPGNGSTETSAPSVLFVEGVGTLPCYGFISGALVKCSNAGIPTTKQNPVLGAGWAQGPVGGSYRSLQYWLDGMDNLVISGTFHSTSTTPAATIFSLSSAWRPAQDDRPPVNSNVASTYAARSLLINHTTGAVQIDPAITAANMDVYVKANIPMGNIS